MTNSPRIDLVGVGLNAIDTLIPLPHYPALGSKVEFRSANILPGGQVASAVIACQQWGLRTRYVGKVGEDRLADIHRAEFAKAGVEAHLFTAQGCASQQAFILVDDTGERTVLWKRDNHLTLRPEELKQEWIVEARALHVDGHDTAAAIQAATWAKASGVPVIADLDEVYPGVQALLGSIDYLITSRDIPGSPDGRNEFASRVASATKQIQLPAHSRDVGARRRDCLGRLTISLRRGVSRGVRGHHWSGRYFSRWLYLWTTPGLATRAATRLRLCRSGVELQGYRRARWHPRCRSHRKSDQYWRALRAPFLDSPRTPIVSRS